MRGGKSAGNALYGLIKTVLEIINNSIILFHTFASARLQWKASLGRNQKESPQHNSAFQLCGGEDGMVRSPAASHGTPAAGGTSVVPGWWRSGSGSPVALALEPPRQPQINRLSDHRVCLPCQAAACLPLPQQLRRGFIKTTTCAFLIQRAR